MSLFNRSKELIKITTSICGILAVALFLTPQPCESVDRDIALSQEVGFVKTRHQWVPLIDLCAGEDRISYVYVDTPTLSRDWMRPEKPLAYGEFSRNSPEKLTILTNPTTTHNRAVGTQYAFGDSNGTIGFNYQNGLDTGGQCNLTDGRDEDDPQFVCATSRRMVYLYNDGQWHYQTIDHKSENPAIPSLLVSSGTVGVASPGRLQAIFNNQSYTYQVNLGINSRVAGASVTVLKSGRAVQTEDCRFYSLNRSFVDVVYSLDKSFRPSRFDGVWAAPLANGRVVVMSNHTYVRDSLSALYTPETKKWAMASPMHEYAYTTRNHFLLPNQNLAVWGWNSTSGIDSNGLLVGDLWVDIFNERTSSWTKVPLLRNTSGHLVLLPNEKMLAVHDRKTDQMSSILDLSSLSWSEGPRMHYASQRNQVFQLPDSRVLVLHGSIVLPGNALTVEVYDPHRNVWNDLGPMPPQKGDLLDSGILGNGQVYLSWWNNDRLSLYDPKSNHWSVSAVCPYGDSSGTQSIPIRDSHVLFFGQFPGSQGTRGKPHMIAYDAKTDRWADMVLPPSFREQMLLSWLRMGDDMVAFYRDYHSCESHLALFDSAKDAWVPLPSPTVCRTVDAILALPRRRILVYGIPAASLDPDDFAEIVPLEQ